MENASKALIIAGSVFLSLLIITALVFTFEQIATLKQTEASSEEEKLLAQYNKKIESFNKSGLYGSEIMSLVNYIDDYNIRQAELKGYKAISLNIDTKEINDAKYLKKSYTSYKELISDLKKLETQINKLENQKICGEALKKLAGLNTNDLIDTIEKYNAEHSNKYTYEDVQEKIYEYQNLNSELKTFKNKKFKLPNVEYDNITGRILSMTYKEIGI